jgi:fumarate reductase flavoprotein subunit
LNEQQIHTGGETMKEKKGVVPEKLETQIVVAGGGGTGLAAAVAAAEKGASVVVLEKRHNPGGNTAMAGGLFAAESHVQKRLKIDAQKDELFRVTMGYAHWKTDPRLVRAFLDKSADTIRWLEEKGIRFEDVPHYYPNQVPRTLHLPEGRLNAVIKVLLNRCNELGVHLICGITAKKILTDRKGNLTHMVALADKKEIKIAARSVIIGTGGYAGNKRLLKKYYPFYTDNLHSIGLPHMGDGLLMATGVGAATEGLGSLILRGPFAKGPFLITTAGMEPNTIWVNKRGERFVNEATSFFWPEAANALNRQPDKISFTLFDETMMKNTLENGFVKGYRDVSPATLQTQMTRDLELEIRKGRLKVSSSWQEIADWMGANYDVLKNTVDEYNRYCDGRYDKTFLKNPRFLVPLRTAPFYTIKCYPGFLGTAGGIKINHRMEVLDREDNPIPGLYAGGTDTGGWESDTYCMLLSGQAVGFAINSGRIAGENAAKYVQSRAV